jgi:hypothetical protein
MWGGQTQNEDDEQAVFGDSAMTFRTPAKKRNTTNTELQAAPRKPTAKSTTEENDESGTTTRPNARPTEQQHEQTPEDTEINEIIEVAAEPGPARSPMKTLWKTAIGMVKRAKAKLGTQKTKKEIMAEFDEIVTFMEAVHAIEDEMTNVKHELQDIKKTVENSEKVIRDSENTTKRNWAAIVTTQKTPTPSVNLGGRQAGN